MILKNYIKNYLIENLKISDISVINNIVESLNNECEKIFNKLSAQGDEDRFYSYILDHLDYGRPRILSKFQLYEIGEGAFRRAYAIQGEEWVMKLSMSTEGAKINKEEVDISQGKHGLAARDIFLKIYDYDKLTEYPCWIICQKVIPMEDISDLNILKNVFPTFWNMIKEGDIHKSAGHHFISMIASALTMFGYYLGKKKYKQIPEKAFYSAVEDLSETYDFNDIVFYDDFKRISAAYSYVRSTDMHEGNFGLVSLQNPSPESFVILDFDADSHI